MNRSRKRREAHYQVVKDRLDKLNEQVHDLESMMVKLAPNSREQKAAGEKLADLKAQWEAGRAHAEREFEQLDARELSVILTDIQRIAAKVASDRGYRYVVKVTPLPANAAPSTVGDALKDSIVYADPGSDMTDEVLREYDQQSRDPERAPGR